ncbi:peptide chain release factor N(5)-glutamine methyltransferase [Candidatus Dojkabacteria bacterium]|uniref:peptide chain release factor N(5)-glutamine methyltransferase n=1 Tax=Candidatus Dojkabacteria bacterium TaxID=2099670 RepID=A0A955I5S7_9BACT|nr:peptide chain release factor N(5)-glutamine methyltransferase [Candidatus Dojkabacteria bacterium]
MRRVNEKSIVTIRDALGLISTSLSKHYLEPYTYALSLLSSDLQTSKNDLILNLDNTLTKSQVKTITTLIDKLNRDYPISYIMGNIDFYKENYSINESVLIPRPETELLVEMCINKINTRKENVPTKILEIGTGSGCISISIMNNVQNNNVQIIATDISVDALKLASENVQRNLQKHRQKQISFVRQDALTEYPSETFDFIVSNPPYIPFDEYKKLEKSLFYEPQIALTDSSDGLHFYKRLAHLVQNNLNTGGMALFELHSTNVNNIIKVFKDEIGESVVYDLRKDTFGRERFLQIIT